MLTIEQQLAKARAPANPEYVVHLVHPSCKVHEEYQIKLKALKEDLESQIETVQDELNRISDRGSGRLAEIREEELLRSLSDLKARLRTSLDFKAPDAGPSVGQWRQAIEAELKVWVAQRQKQKIPSPRRFAAEEVNSRGFFDLRDVSYYVHQTFPLWYHLSFLDYYDCVWHCKRCFATSDVWVRLESRPPAACPNCAYQV
jgi:hypothetical protein